MMEQTLIVIKPDGVRRGLIGRVFSRFEDKGFRIVDFRMMTFSKKCAEEFYSPHMGKPFFQDLISFIISGPVVAIIVEGSSAIDVVRRMIGPTKSAEAPAGTIRGDFSLGLTNNIVHASDSSESFVRESALIFESTFGH